MRLMSAILLTLTTTLLTPLLAEAQQPASEDATRREIDGLLTAWHKAAAVADEGLYFDSLAEDAVFMGTDPGERWTKPELWKMAEPYFKGGSAWVFEAVSRNIDLADDGQTAWFDELLRSESYWTSRGSGVLSKTKQGWKIRQYNLALMIPNAVVKEIKPIVDRALAEPTQ